MKKIFLIMLVVLGSLGMYADEPTGKALTMRGEILNYLRSEGYMPKIDSDGDIQFKREGVSYWISLDNYGQYVYANTYSSMDTKGASMYRVRSSANTAQRKYKFVRCNVYDSSVSVSVPLPIKTLSEYKGFFPDVIDIIINTKKVMKEEYNEEN